MKKIVVLLIAFLFIACCAGVQKVKKEIKEEPNYSGKWTGQSFIDGQGMVDNIDLNLVHEGGAITGVISDTQGFMSNAILSNTELKGKSLTFSFIASTPMGNVQVNTTGTFSDDGKELVLSFKVPNLNIGGNAKLKKS